MSFAWLVERANGEVMSAIELQRLYLKEAQIYRGESAETDWVLDEWESVLNGLEKDPMAMGDRLDWVAKRHIVEEYMTEEKLDWSDDALHSVDLEYHNIDPELSLFHAYQEMGKTRRMLTDLDITLAMTDPPDNTRAVGRSKLVERILAKKKPQSYAFDWNGVQIDKSRYVEMPDPFNTYLEPVDQWGNKL